MKGLCLVVLRARGLDTLVSMCPLMSFVLQLKRQKYTLRKSKWTHSFKLGCQWHFWALSVQSVQSLSCVLLFVTPWTAARKASLSIPNSWSSPKLMSIELVKPYNHLILCCPLLLPPSISPNIRVFSNESALRIRWPKYWSFSFNISPSSEHPGLISFRMDWLDLLQSKGISRVFSNTTVQKHQYFGAQLSSQSNSHIHTWPQEKP